VSEYPTYAIDDDTQELLESAMNLAQRVIDLQEDDETAESMQYELEELAERFNIQRARVVTTETAREDGSVDINIKLEQENKPPKFTVIDGNKLDPKIVPLKPTDPTKP
jgi:nitrogen fixation/metabolism regulation signal transduction histidine kinase